ncbi:DUF3047 domain-containing protein [Piscinibacter sakaiensis]|uniref:DUF3047 domain-containing protein n=1 Tax=Piscinibacter sakaiensis TaxID=1547922 RepID=UPI003AAAF282
MCLAAALSACAIAPQLREGDEVAASPWASASDAQRAESAWAHQTFPGKRASHYRPQRKDGRDTVMVRASSSASMVRRRVRIEPGELGRLRFSWLVPEVIASADMTRHDREDSPVRVVLAFDGDRSKFSAKDAMKSELAETLTGEPMPYATLMYVWSNDQAAESVLVNPRTSRIRKLVVERGADNVGRWLSYERDVCADFRKAFGESPGRLLSIAIMTDTDNTRSEAKAWYGPVRHVPAAGGCLTAE